jgi:xylulokinase
MGSYVCGVDIGISRVKVIILRKDGFVAARGEETCPAPIAIGRERFQDASIWWEKTTDALKNAITALENSGGMPEEICSICIDATSGTIVPVDENCEPVYTGIMYNDSRAQKEIDYLNEVGKDCIQKLGYRFNSSFALPKILNIKNEYPEVWSKTKYILHQADFITHRLMGGGDRIITDTSNALKSGYDILNMEWPEYIRDLDIAYKLPDVVPTGSVMGHISNDIAKQFGFSADVKVIAGMTDSVAACLASGARNLGDMNTILGSTITWKVLSKEIVYDKEGRVYSHLHPAKCFLLGGVGNSGGFGIKSMLDASPEELTAYATGKQDIEPSECFAYPLPSKGEKYPFIDYEFSPFITKGNCKGAELYKALIEGASCIERMGYEAVESMGAKIEGVVWTTGGGAMVDMWMKTRANILNRVILRSRYPESAFGAALIAAMSSWFNGDFVKTADSFILEQARFEPDPVLVEKYEEYYQKFVSLINERINVFL